MVLLLQPVWTCARMDLSHVHVYCVRVLEGVRGAVRHSTRGTSRGTPIRGPTFGCQLANDAATALSVGASPGAGMLQPAVIREPFQHRACLDAPRVQAVMSWLPLRTVSQVESQCSVR